MMDQDKGVTRRPDGRQEDKKRWTQRAENYDLVTGTLQYPSVVALYLALPGASSVLSHETSDKETAEDPLR